MNGFKIGETNIALSMDKTIVDSGTSYISMPKAEYLAMYNELAKDHSCWLSM